MAVIGIDVGTQSLKAIAVGRDMKARGHGSVSYQPSYPRPGWAEQDADLWLSALRPAIGEALQAARLTADDVMAIGVTGQLDGCLAVGSDGSPLAPCIIWMDRRASAEIADIDPELIRSRAGLVCDSTHMAAKIRWSRQHMRLADDVAIWHQPVSFVVATLCGRAVMDHALASTTMLYGLAERDYADELLTAFGIDRRTLPDIDEASAPAGTLSKRGAELTGLRAGTLIAVGTGDDYANPIGAGVTEPGIVACNLGTGEAIGTVSTKPLIDADGLVETHGFVGDRFFISNPGWLAGGSVTWFLSAFGIDSPETLSALAEAAPVGSDDLLFLPALSGAMAPRWVAGARGAFYGLTPKHKREECGRALLEGCAFAMRDVVDRLAALGLCTDCIRLSGGGARSRIWAQIRADVANRRVEYQPAEDAAPLGAAILAAVAAGIAGNVRQAAKSLSGPFASIEPNRVSHAAYERAYWRYRRLFDALTPMFEESAHA
jgi:xylulokinase